MSNHEAINRYIWVLKEETVVKEQVTASGLIMSAAKTTVVQEKGVVAFVGMMCDEKVKRVISPGDTILFEHSTKGKVVDGVEYLLIVDTHILMKF